MLKVVIEQTHAEPFTNDEGIQYPQSIKVEYEMNDDCLTWNSIMKQFLDSLKALGYGYLMDTEEMVKILSDAHFNKINENMSD